jgi:hypothetical protein
MRARYRVPGRLSRLAMALLAAVGLSSSASAQVIPYFGKNKVKYDAFAWRIYKSPHFEVYYYPEFEQHLARLTSYLESSYQKVSTTLKHEIGHPIPAILYKTSSEFQQTNLFQGFMPDGVLAFAEPQRGRLVLPIDEPPDELQGLVTHELTHLFAFDLIPRGLGYLPRNIPLWVDEGLAEYTRGLWDPMDLMQVRDAAIADTIPRLSRTEFEPLSGRLVYNIGHAAFEYMEARFGKEGVRQFLYAIRKNALGGNTEDLFNQAFRTSPEEFDEGFDRWLKERFKPFRDKQRPVDYGKDIAPNPEKTSYTQVIGFAPSPTGELIAALTANMNDGELDVVLLSARDGEVIRNLTSGYTGRWEHITEAFSARGLGRSLSFDPSGETVAFFGRTGKRRSLFRVSVISGKVLQQVEVKLDEPQAPCLLPDGKRLLFVALNEGVSDIYLLDLESGKTTNLTQDAFHDDNPQVSPDGKLVAFSRRVSGYEKVYVLPLAEPQKKTQLTFGAHNDNTPVFSADGKTIYYSSDEDDDIPNVRSLDLRTGVIRQFTDALGGNMVPAPLSGSSGKVAFVTYYKGDYGLRTVDTAEPMKEVEQETLAASEQLVDFQPDVVHQVLPQNKRGKRLFEKLMLEGRPPINVGVTSGGDMFGGTQVALTDVLGDQNFLLTFLSVQELRSYDFTYVNLGRRLQYGFSAFDITSFFYASPYALYSSYGREGAFATQRVTGANLQLQYPLDKFRRVTASVGGYRLSEGYADPAYEELAREQAALLGVPYFMNNGTLYPLTLGFVQETTRFREFGPLSGSTVALQLEFAPPIAGGLSRRSIELDARKYLRIGPTSALLALRFRGFRSTGDNPGIVYFGGNMELRGYQYLGFVGTEGFHANAELRIPLVHVMATPIGLIGPVRGTAYFGVGGAKLPGDPFRFASSDPGLSYLNDPIFGEPVSGFHLVDGRASYGIGLQAFLFGYPFHFDWSKYWDFQVSSNSYRFDFWIGFDF